MQKVPQHDTCHNPNPQPNPQHAQGAKLVFVALEHSDAEPQHVVLPLCNGCGKLITNLTLANIDVDFKFVDTDGCDFPVLATEKGARFLYVGPAECYCFECSERLGRRGPWMRAENVIRNDQRYPHEREMAEAEGR